MEIEQWKSSGEEAGTKKKIPVSKMVVIAVILLNILQFPALTLCNSANGGKTLILRCFRHLPFGRVVRICRRIPA